MLILYTMYVLIFIFLMIIIGAINFNTKIKYRFFITASILYNGFMGYAVLLIYKIASIYFSNIPKGLLGRYAVPEVEAWFNFGIGLFIVLTYAFCLIPINVYMYNKSNSKAEPYIGISVVSAITGILIYLLT